MNMPPFEISITNIPFDLKSSSTVARIPQSFISAVSILYLSFKRILEPKSGVLMAVFKDLNHWGL